MVSHLRYWLALAGLIGSVVGLIGVVGGCACPTHVPPPPVPTDDRIVQRLRTDVQVIHVRTCDYVLARTVNGISIVHAGDCRRGNH